MNSGVVIAICLFFVAGLGALKAEEYDESPELYSEDQFDEKPYKSPTEAPKPSKYPTPPKKEGYPKAVAPTEPADTEAAKHKGLCHWGIKAWYKPGFQIKCSCMRCTCQKSGNWECGYHFPYCPYFYCGGHIYNPKEQVCCCGKVYDKKSNWACCGYFQYYTGTHKCCNYYTVKHKSSNCPKHKV